MVISFHNNRWTNRNSTVYTWPVVFTFEIVIKCKHLLNTRTITYCISRYNFSNMIFITLISFTYTVRDEREFYDFYLFLLLKFSDGIIHITILFRWSRHMRALSLLYSLSFILGTHIYTQFHRMPEWGLPEV